MTKMIINSNGAKKADAANNAKICFEFIKGFLTKGSPHRPHIKTPSPLVL